MIIVFLLMIEGEIRLPLFLAFAPGLAAALE